MKRIAFSLLLALLQLQPLVVVSFNKEMLSPLSEFLQQDEKVCISFEGLIQELVGNKSEEELRLEAEKALTKHHSTRASLSGNLSKLNRLLTETEKAALYRVVLELAKNSDDSEASTNIRLGVIALRNILSKKFRDQEKYAFERLMIFKICVELARHNRLINTEIGALFSIIERNSHSREITLILKLSVLLAQNNLNLIDTLRTLKYYLRSNKINQNTQRIPTLELAILLAQNKIKPENFISWCSSLRDSRNLPLYYELAALIGKTGIDPTGTIKILDRMTDSRSEEVEEAAIRLTRSLTKRGIDAGPALFFISKTGLQSSKEDLVRAIKRIEEIIMEQLEKGKDPISKLQELNEYYNTNQYGYGFSRIMQNLLFTDSEATQNLFFSIVKTEKIFNDLDLKEFALGTQSYIKILILDQIMKYQPVEPFLIHLQEVILPGLRVVEKLTKDQPALGIGFPRSLEDKKEIADETLRQAEIEIFLTNFLSDVQMPNNTKLPPSEITSEKTYQLRTLPTTYPILILYIQKLHSLGIINSFKNYTTKVEGEHLEEYPFVFSMLYYTMIPHSIKPGALQPENIGQIYDERIYAQIVSRLVGPAFDAWDPELEKVKTHIFHNLLSPRDTGVENEIDLILKDLRRTFAFTSGTSKTGNRAANRLFQYYKSSVGVFFPYQSEILKLLSVPLFTQHPELTPDPEELKKKISLKKEQAYWEQYRATKELLKMMAEYFFKNRKKYAELQDSIDEFVSDVEEKLFPKDTLSGKIVRLAAEGKFLEIKKLLNSTDEEAVKLRAVAQYPESKPEAALSGDSKFNILNPIRIMDPFSIEPLIGIQI